MKKKMVWIVMAGVLGLLFQSFNQEEVSVTVFPEDVNEILVSACYDCHSTDSQSKDAREALNFKQWDDYRITKKIGLLDKTCDLVEKEKMPPARYLENNPDKKLSDAQKQVICDWTKKETAALMGSE